MLTKLSKTVAIAFIMCSSSLFAQKQESQAAISQPIVKDSVQAQATTEPAIPNFDDTKTNKESDNKTSVVPLVPEIPTATTTPVEATTPVTAPIAVQTVAPTPEPSPNQAPTETPKQAETTPIQVTQRPANSDKNTPVVANVDTTSKETSKESAPKEKKPLRSDKSIQTMNFYLPIESETWKVGSRKLEWNSMGYQFSWNRYKTEKNGYSSVFGLGIGFLTGELKDGFFDKKVDLKGLDFNIKFGLGMAPISNDLIVAIHFLSGFDLKMLEGEVNTETMKYSPGAVYIDALIGGDLIIGYHILESLGLIGGVDITTNAFGIGGYSREPSKASKAIRLSYLFSGINVTPHIGMFFVF